MDANGSILSFVIEDNGTGYRSSPSVVISGGGYGASAIATWAVEKFQQSR